MNRIPNVTGAAAPGDLPLGRGHLLLIGTGAIGVTMLPAWATMLQSWYENLEIETILTRSAERLVRRNAIEAVTRKRVHRSFWDESGVSHRSLADWADLVLVVPATMNFISKTSLGITETLALYIATITPAPVVVAPSAPQRILTSTVGARHLRNLAQNGFHVMPTREGIAISTGDVELGGMANIVDVVAFASTVLTTSGEKSNG